MGFGQPHISAVPARVPVIQSVDIVDYGRVVFRGSVDVNYELDRIRRGQKLNHRNDGSFFRNREDQLPMVRDREFYREFVYTQQGLKFPGPARLVISKAGTVYFTGDHYSTFRKVNP